MITSCCNMTYLCLVFFLWLLLFLLLFSEEQLLIGQHKVVAGPYLEAIKRKIIMGN